jgi:hypothetical protein
MRSRCNNTNHSSYAGHGGRGITVCKRWDSFENFLSDMGERPEGKTLDRRDNEGNYTPENCRWATPKEQSRNRRDNRLLTYKGETRTVVEWAEIHNIDIELFRSRLRGNWTIEEIILTPLGQKRRSS